MFKFLWFKKKVFISWLVWIKICIWLICLLSFSFHYTLTWRWIWSLFKSVTFPLCFTFLEPFVEEAESFWLWLIRHLKMRQIILTCVFRAIVCNVGDGPKGLILIKVNFFPFLSTFLVFFFFWQVYLIGGTTYFLLPHIRRCVISDLLKGIISFIKICIGV